ncbi:alpha/beta hydrolase [Paenibacillus koleovorans]|uniref:alpha/beta hydrolase n=1 Tax=Paenibacillus koleovorans TaxID=121608 RepID=UPI000FDB8B4B|nr:alpha/beta hydrolase family protein [Paenibacillus koleovorans]
MALLHVHFPSPALGIAASMEVILPDPQPEIASDPNRKLPTLLLLHGLSDDHSAWVRRTSIERYAAGRNIAILMPAVNRSFYTDMEYGAAYWTFVSEELPATARSYFPLSDKREDNFVAGLSMGGYGAFKLALTHPDRYAAAASLSGALDIVARAAHFTKDYRNIFGEQADQLEGSKHDVFHLASQAVASGAPMPSLFQACGTEDYLYADNQRFLGHARELGLPLAYEEEAGAHNWAYWDMKISRVLDWLPAAGK